MVWLARCGLGEWERAVEVGFFGPRVYFLGCVMGQW